MGYSVEEKRDIIRIYYSNHHSAKRTRAHYQRVYPERQTPSKSTIIYILRQFEQRKTLERKKRSAVGNEEEDLNVLLFFEGNYYQ